MLEPVEYYVWVSDPHDGERKRYTLGVHGSVAADLGTVLMPLFSPKRETMLSAHVREYVKRHAVRTGASVRLIKVVESELIDIVGPADEPTA